MITLACSQGHLFGVTRSHELPEVTLGLKRAPADHSCNIGEMDRLKSVGLTEISQGVSPT